jgi:hypothetical protein
VIFFYFVPDTARDISYVRYIIHILGLGIFYVSIYLFTKKVYKQVNNPCLFSMVQALLSLG